MTTNTKRMEFGLERTTCDCKLCRLNCLHMPGFLIPSDLERMIPAEVDPMLWAEINLLASPGALVARHDGTTFRIPTLVPAVKADRSCINLQPDGHCKIHLVSPFGCAYFDCKNPRYDLSHTALILLAGVWHQHSEGKHRHLYCLLWEHLASLGKTQRRPDELRKLIAAEVQR